MSTDIDIAEYEEKRQENLETLHELREELQTIAESDADWAEYAENALSTLRQEGYDV